MIRLNRCLRGSDGIFGMLSDDDNSYTFGVTLEHSYFIDSIWLPKIPEGVYVCQRGPHRLSSMSHDFDTFEITQVPGHSNLLFHPGNFDRNSTGCVLLGAAIVNGGGDRMITQSLHTFEQFMEYMGNLTNFKLTVQNNFV